jgi:hypothetical protein
MSDTGWLSQVTVLHYFERKGGVKVTKISHRGTKLGGKLEITLCFSEIVRCPFSLVLIF